MSRALHILTLLEQAEGEPMPLGDIARGIGAAKSSTSNLCQVLEDGRMISRTATGCCPRPPHGRARRAYIARFNQIREFYDYCTTSPLLSHEVLQIAMLDGTEVLIWPGMRGTLRCVLWPASAADFRLPRPRSATLVDHLE